MTRLILALLIWLVLCVPARAALSQAQIGGACDTANNTVFTTASITPTAGALTLLAVVVTSETTATTVTGAGLTWAQVTSASVTFDTTGTPTSRLQVFRGTGTPTAGALTITAGGTTSGMCWKAFEFTGQDPTTPIPQAAVGNGNAQTALATAALGAFGSVNNWTVWIASFDDDTGTSHGGEAGYNTIGGAARVSMATPNYSLMAYYLNGNDTTPTATAGAARNYGAIAFEVAEDPGGVGARQCLGSMMGTGC